MTLDLTGRRYRCPECKSWQLSRKRSLGLIRCLACRAGLDRHELLDTEANPDAVSNLDDVKRKDRGPSTGLAAELAEIGEQRDGSDA